MSERSRSAFTTGAFARLCGTTKETLFHYDAIGLLKPKEVRPNGYRAYAPEQFFDFDMVRMLRRAGSSLKEIKGY
ncbi:MerR family transcriptional regulator, partial [Akkermansia muciniphila]|uniref:MerR family transcriptional regulator n=1 Tax=Akkermansia muciniphila TaxID=239935 RepID=UPI00122F0F3E